MNATARAVLIGAAAAFLGALLYDLFKNRQRA